MYIETIRNVLPTVGTVMVVKDGKTVAVAVLRPAQAACRRRDPGAAAMKSTLALIVGVLVALGLLQSAYVIDQSEQAIVVQFGEPVGELVTPPACTGSCPSSRTCAVSTSAS
jgi:hypothetical protein